MCLQIAKLEKHLRTVSLTANIDGGNHDLENQFHRLAAALGVA
jgi:hypothetical protein